MDRAAPGWFGREVIAIRLTCSSDLAAIQRIELAAGELFREIGMADIADHPVPTLAVLADFQRAGHSWVAVDGSDRPVAFVLVRIVDGRAHVEQVSVDPAYARRRIGRDLIDHVESWAAGRGLSALSLTTFRDVEWNGPYYGRLGFAVLAPAGHGPELAALIVEEVAHGLDPARRIAMIRPIHRPR
ncbi:GNAT family N-acetyltransferase [Actinoplanes sp. ATCC 53533]|uniref:GNAT family N-acetyltransferase n=1 Tax=Actinoplanes sp. ATCC 53533 TaxID=1288362 RepID=UPI001F2117FF|nr:GNAT family N-acetyltransferase [Actinoplanes sp. ATCC 53533]